EPARGCAELQQLAHPVHPDRPLRTHRRSRDDDQCRTRAHRHALGRQPPAERRLPRPRFYLSPRISKEPCMTASKTAIPLPLSPVLPDGELLESAMLPGSAEAAAAVAEADARAQARGAGRAPLRREPETRRAADGQTPEGVERRAT